MFLCCISNFQVVFQRMQLARKLAEEHEWAVTQELPHPLQSTLAKGRSHYSEMTSLLVESSDRERRMELQFQWKGLTVRLARLKHEAAADTGLGPGIGSGPGLGLGEEDGSRWEDKCRSTQELTGTNFREKILSLFTDQY